MTLENAVASNVLGTMGAVFWSVQTIPQIYKSHREKSTKGLSTWLMAIWTSAGIWLGSLNISSRSSIPLIVQPECFTVLCCVSWAQCLHYGSGWSRNAAICFVVGYCLTAGALQVGFVAASRTAERHGSNAPTLVWGIMSAIFILGGVLPQYLEIYKYKAVFGISLIFLFVDLLGGLVSCLSLIFEPSFDVLTSVSYGGLVVLELGIFALAGILNPRMKRKKKKEAEERQMGVDVDEGRTSGVELETGSRTEAESRA